MGSISLSLGAFLGLLTPEAGPPRSSSFETVCSLFTYNTVRIPVTSPLAAVCINFLLPYIENKTEQQSSDVSCEQRRLSPQ